ncbi:UvrD-helicase domain-containing protein [Pseudonocardia humida]|uniref:UvrD-helicase domain-containing protein n=1 Tax=Pseudonocardia humida TaxID=2800819 RepID=UPI00207CB281|nr:UvrD-helicase domain-containing protein [Pseudonocardia humida]
MSTPLLDLESDRRDVARFYRELDSQRAAVQAELTDRLRGGTGSSPGERATHETAVRSLRTRITRLGAGRDGLCLGWIEDTAGERTHIGRIGLLDAEFEPLVVDWRAPAARPFYTATPAHPEGLAHRRHLRTRGREVLDAYDDLAGGRGADLALLDAVDAPRTGAMRDIVATIQREQDEIIRLEVPGTLVVEGGPGTGKTAVALHRVAYLLYTRPVLARRGVLVVGPHPRLLDHIDQVLPALGESDVVFATVGTLLPGLSTTAQDPPRTARVKGSAAMVDVLAAAVADRQELPDEPMPVELEDVTVELDRGIAERARARARATGALHNEARPVFRAAVLDALAEQAVDRIGTGWLAPRESPELAADLRADARAELRATPALHAAVDALWPALTPARLLAELWASPERIAVAAAALPEADRAALHRPDGAAWTASDVPLLDEAFELLGREPDRRPADRERARAAEVQAFAEGVRTMLDDDGWADEDEILAADLVAADVLADRQRELDVRSTAERAAADREWVYGHVVVDEAQELSEMDWRTLARRCPTRSFTIVGDLAQRRAAGGVRAWEQVAAGAVPGRWALRRLTVDYRTPAEIAAVAADVLAEHLPGHSAPRPVRATGTVPWARRVDPDELEGAVRAAVADVEGPGTTTVITPVPLPELPGATVLAPHEAKGLEFDVVLLVEPDEILAASPADLYVALTRATQHLGVLHTRDLPTALRRLAPR